MTEVVAVRGAGGPVGGTMMEHCAVEGAFLR